MRKDSINRQFPVLMFLCLLGLSAFLLSACGERTSSSRNFNCEIYDSEFYTDEEIDDAIDFFCDMFAFNAPNCSVDKVIL